MNLLPAAIEKQARNIRLLVLDVDGVLTDGTLYYSASGENMKGFNAKDGFGIRLLKENNIQTAVITARESAALARRMEDLNITLFYPGCVDKQSAFDELLKKLSLDAGQVAYAGDDLLDLPVMRRVGLAITVADGHRLVQAEADWITSALGGKGAVREIADGLISSQISRINKGFNVVIPARYASSRLPGKPLRLIAGKTMIQRVYEIGLKSGAAKTIVATDDERIKKEVERFGGEVVMTSLSHRSGTDRVAEVVQILGWKEDTVVVNLQGDEPSVDQQLLGTVAHALHDHPEAGIATLASPITDRQELLDINAVKVVINQNSMALYFSRSPIPFVRDDHGKKSEKLPVFNNDVLFLRHIGLYAYRVGVLFEVAAANPSAIETAESLEQLRAMDMGIGIHVSIVEALLGHGVDTENDLNLMESLLGA